MAAPGMEGFRSPGLTYDPPKNGGSNESVEPYTPPVVHETVPLPDIGSILDGLDLASGGTVIQTDQDNPFAISSTDDFSTEELINDVLQELVNEFGMDSEVVRAVQLAFSGDYSSLFGTLGSDFLLSNGEVNWDAFYDYQSNLLLDYDSLYSDDFETYFTESFHFNDLNLYEGFNLATFNTVDYSYDQTYYVGTAGDDLFNNLSGDDTIDGGEGVDILQLGFNVADLSNISKLKSGGHLISSVYGNDAISNIEYLSFLDGTTTAADLLGLKLTPNINVNGKATQLNTYTGPVQYLEYEYIGESSNDTIVGSMSNDFFNLKEGDDAADGGLGDDVLDGGAGSNFLTGGLGSDTFFLDGRDGDVTWSTITDFSGDTVNIWGWQDGVSQLVMTEVEAGAQGFKGATFHYDLDSDGNIDTSITFSGLTLSDLPESSAHIIEDNGYLFFG